MPLIGSNAAINEGGPAQSRIATASSQVGADASRRDGERKVTYGDIFLQAEKEYSRHNFEYADVDMLFKQFTMAEGACRKYLDDGWTEDDNNVRRNLMAQPAYDQCIKASHVFNLLDARGVISVT